MIVVFRSESVKKFVAGASSRSSRSLRLEAPVTFRSANKTNRPVRGSEQRLSRAERNGLGRAAPPLTKEFHVTPRIVRWGLLSTARINERLIGPFRNSPRSELIAVASRTSEKAQSYAAKWDIPRAYGSYDQLLADDEINAIYISLPNGLHAEWAVQCAEAGKHVLCEKPLALSINEVDRIEQAASRNRVIVQEAAMMRYHPQTAHLSQLVADRIIGDVKLVRGVFTYVLDNQQDVRMDPDQGGGSLWDLGSYCVRFVRTVLGDEPLEVVGSQITSTRGVDLSFSGQMRFSSGAQAHFFSSLESFGHVGVDLLGTRGRIEVTSPWAQSNGCGCTRARHSPRWIPAVR